MKDETPPPAGGARSHGANNVDCTGRGMRHVHRVDDEVVGCRRKVAKSVGPYDVCVVGDTHCGIQLWSLEL